MQSSRFKKLLAAGVVALVLAGSAVGVVAAQQAATPTPAGQPQTRETRFQRFIDVMASKLGVSPDQVKQAFTEARKEVGPFHWEWRSRPAQVRKMVRHELAVAAKAIGVTPRELHQELAGKSLSDVATAHNVDPATVANALRSDAHARVDQLVSNGKLAADRAATIKQRISDRIDRLMTHQFKARPVEKAPQPQPSS